MQISEQQKCLLGICLQFFGQGYLFLWGKCNVYYYSYYKEKDPSLPYSYNYMIAIFLALPVFILSLIALPISKYFGFRTTIISLAILSMISTAISSYMPNYILFLFFYAFINGMIYVVQYYPSLKCLWSHYSNNEGKVLGIAFGVFNASVFSFLLFITYMINPDDKKATLEINEGTQTFYYFDNSVSKNVPKTVLALAIIAGTFNIIGSFLINFNEEVKEKIDNNNNETVSEIEMQENIKLPVSNKEFSSSDPLKEKKQLLYLLRTKQFCIFFVNKFALMLYMILFGINFKQYSLTKVNDDYFITYVENSSILVASITNILFGFLVDRAPYKKLLFYMFFNVGIIGILFPVISNHGEIYFALGKSFLQQNLGLLILNILDMGTIVIIPSALMKVFTKEVGVVIYPYINTGAKLGLLLGPIIQMVGLKIIDLDSLLMLCGCLIILSSLAIIFLEKEKEEEGE